MRVNLAGTVAALASAVSLLASGLGLAVGVGILDASPAVAHRGSAEPGWIRSMAFPVQADQKVSYRDDFGDCRDGCTRYHEGNDIIGARLMPLVAPVDGTVTRLDVDLTLTTKSGNDLYIKDADGWQYVFRHINNDTPGTDDNLNPPEYRYAPGIAVGAKVKMGDVVAFMGDSGNAETSVPHLHFEIRTPKGTPVDPYVSLRFSQGKTAGNQCTFPTNPPLLAVPGAAAAASTGLGYWVLGRDGGVFTFGDATFYGSTGGMKLNRPVVGMSPTTKGAGYWLVATDGGVFAFGDATFFGSTGAMALNQPVIGMSATSTGKGYWLVAADGGVFAFGDAGFVGSTGGTVLPDPIITMAPTPSGKGYLLLDAAGRVYAFGDGAALGGLPDLPAAAGKKAAGIAATTTGLGYWILTTDGSVFTFGDAVDYGDLTREGLCKAPTAVAIRPTRSGKGYVVAAADGSVWVYGDARWRGDLPDLAIKPNAAVLGVSVLDRRGA